MSAQDRAVIRAQIEHKWRGELFVPNRGHVFVNPIRAGGLTDQLVILLTEIADQHYTKQYGLDKDG